MNKKKYIYLVQGQAELLSKYQSDFSTRDREVILLTYDKPCKGAIFYPSSTWAEGRNKLLEEAISRGEYEYYIFCDDDIAFEKGGYCQFEKNLETYRPSIAVPVVPRTKRSVLSIYEKYQSFLVNDEQMIAFNNNVVKEKIVLPYNLRFDSLHWWATCQLQEILIQNFYRFDAIQFNNVEVINLCKRRYDASEIGREFRTQLREWLSKQFKNKFIDIRQKYKKNRIKSIPAIVVMYRTSMFYFRKKCKKKGRIVGMSKIERCLRKDCELIKHIKEELSDTQVD